MTILDNTPNKRNKNASSSDATIFNKDAANILTEVEIDSGVSSIRRLYRSRILYTVAIGLLLVLIVILWNWAQYQSQHVISRNAVVRGQITEVGTRFNGVLATTEVGEGLRVRGGQVLGRLVNQHINAEVREIQAKIEGLEREKKLEQSTIEYEHLKREGQLQESVARLASADAELVAAKSRADEAHEFYQARLEMLNRQLISRDVMRQAEAEHRTATAMMNAIQANRIGAEVVKQNASLELKSLDLRVQHLDVLDANLRAASAQLERAHANLEGTLIRAPGDGTVIRWLIKTGGSIRVGQPVVLISVGNDTWIEAWIDEDQIHLIDVGNSAIVTLPSYSGQEFKGVVDSIGVATDFEQPIDAVPQPRASRMRGAPVVSALVRLHDAPANLLPGLSVTVAILRDNN